MQPLSCFAVSISDTHDFRIEKTTLQIKKLLQGAAVLSLAAIFVSLGLWQLGRAQDLTESKKKALVVDTHIYSLPELTSPEGALPVAAYGKSVALEAHYIANFKAPHQKDSSGVTADWDVALAQVDTGSAILVVRGLWSQRFSSPEIVMATSVKITGKIYPTQYDDRAIAGDNELSRLDSSLLTSISDFQLYDGFLVADSEATRNGVVNRARVSSEIPEGGIPGYYWQHISYVAIWWLMAGLVLWAPFYKRRDDLQPQALE